MFTKLTRTQRLLIVIAISLCFFIAEMTAGFYTGSLALIADAFHYLNDLVGFVVTYSALKLSERKEFPKQLSFGWQRATILGAFFNGVFLFALGLSVFLQSVERFIGLRHVDNPEVVVIVGCIGLIFNIVGITCLHEHKHEHGGVSGHAHSGHDLAVAAALWHVLGDAATNLGVIVAGSIMWKAQFSARDYADPATSMAIALVVLCSSLPLMKKSGAILLGRVPKTPKGRDIDVDNVKHDLETLPAVLTVHDLHLWRLNQHKSVATVRVVVNCETMAEFMQLASTVDAYFHKRGIHSVTLHPEILHRPVAPPPTGTSLQSHIEMTAVQRRESTDLGCRSDEPNCWSDMDDHIDRNSMSVDRMEAALLVMAA